MEIKDLQQWVREDWDKESKLINHQTEMLLLIEEIGELAEAIRKLLGNKKRKKMKADLIGEFGDVLISLITLANHYQIDLEKAFLKSKQKIKIRHQQGY
ncbi:MAG: RS21-C6 protein [Candidatus Aenigmarchaeota archaeon]|nr:RS21-C6 protein [Candidatus Aenigmarchaeota archaeon]